jgi:hypothetical protein
LTLLGKGPSSPDHRLPEEVPLDPADHLITATARAGGCVLAATDERIRVSALVKTVWWTPRRDAWSDTD